MSRFVPAIEQIRTAEYARIARWFRDTEFGPVLYDPAGRAWPINADQRTVWEARGRARVDRLLIHYRRLPLYVFGTMLVVFALWTVAMALVGPLTPALQRMPVAFVIAPAAFLPLLAIPLFRQRQSAWRNELVASIVMATALPEAEAAPHRRHNLFAHGRDLVTVAMMLGGGYLVWRGEVDNVDFLLPFLGLLALCWLLHWAAGRVDSTHRRRRWLI